MCIVQAKKDPDLHVNYADLNRANSYQCKSFLFRLTFGQAYIIGSAYELANYRCRYR
jgi:hypothetical protein